MKPPIRCPWCPPDDPLYIAYHDEEWGIPQRDGRALFEMLNLEGAQAGLSWRTILRKRDHYRRVFEGFIPAKLARWTDAQIEQALQDPGIVRNRLKVTAVTRNAHALQRHFNGDLAAFSAFLWDFVGDRPVENCFRRLSEVPSCTPVSDRMSRELRKREFTFVGSTICYAFMQAVGMVNDHVAECFRFRKPQRARRLREAGSETSCALLSHDGGRVAPYCLIIKSL